MIKITLPLVFGVAFVLSACTNQSAPTQYLHNSDTMPTYRVATLYAFPPFDQDDTQGGAVGFDMDIINYIAEHQGFKATYAVQNWTGILEGLNEGSMTPLPLL